MNKWENLVSEFGRLIGVPDLEIESAGACRLEFDERLSMDFELDAQGGLHLYSVMPTVPAHLRPAVALQLIGHNYSAQRQHAEAAFCFDEGAGDFLLHVRVPDHIDELAAFEAVVRRFAETAELWIPKVDALSTEGGSAFSHETAGLLMSHRA